jgi:hypothetical protein
MAAQDDAPANPPETEARPDVEEEAAPEHCQVGDSSYCEDCTDTTCPRHPAPAPLDPLTQAIYDKLDAEYPSMVCTTSIADYVLLAKDCAAAVREAFVAECSPCDECASTTCRVKGLHPAKKNDDAPADPQAADVEELTACIKPALEECAALVVFTCDDDARRLAANVAAVLLKKYGHCITCREECQVDHRDCPGLHPRRQEDAPRVAGDVWPSDILAAALRPAKKDDDAK